MKKPWIGLFGLVFCGISFATPGFAQDIYVHNQSGNNKNNGTSAVTRGAGDGPVRTIAAALLRVPNGGRIVILPSPYPYREAIIINGHRSKGFADSPLIIEGNGVELVGTRPIPPAEWDYYRSGTFRLNRPTTMSGALFLGDVRLPVDDSVNPKSPIPAVDTYALVRGSYYFNLPKGSDLQDYDLAESYHDAGILIHRASHVVIRNLHFRGFGLDAIQVRGPVEGVRIQNCRLSDNGRAGVSAYTLSNVELENCIIQGNAQVGVLAENTSQLYLKSCAITGSPKEMQSSPHSTVRTSGGEPEPLQPGPFFLPPTLERRLTPSPAETETAEQPEPIPPQESTPAKKSFFDE